MSAKDLFFATGKEFTADEKREFAREELIYNVAEDVLVALEDLGVSKSDLAEKLGKSKAYVSQLLSGARNMTLSTFSDICFVLDRKPSVSISEAKINEVGEFLEGIEALWESSSLDVCASESARIGHSENVIDCRDEAIWENQAA